MKTPYLQKLALLLGVLAVLRPAAVFSDYIAPDKVKVKTATYLPAAGSIFPGRYIYKISWQGIPVATSMINVDDPASRPELRVSGRPGFYRVHARTETNDAISILYRLVNDCESIFSTDAMRPVSFLLDQVQNSKSRKRVISFADDGKIVSKDWKEGVLEDDRSFYPNNNTFDPISAAFLAKSVKLEVGQKLAFDIYNGKHRYLITFGVDNKEKLKIEGKEREAFRVTPSVQKLTDTEGEPRLKSVTLWISADERHDILKMQSKVLIGKVTATLSKVEPPQGAVLPPETVHVLAGQKNARASLMP